MARLLPRALALTCVLSLWFGCGAAKDDDKQTDASDPEAASATTAPTSNGGTTTSKTESTSSSTPMPKIARPDQLCGKEGFTYLLSVYFAPQCGACHSNGDFATTNPDTSYPMILALADEDLLRVVTTGQFCSGTCRLEEDDPLFADLKSWLVNKNGCPK